VFSQYVSWTAATLEEVSKLPAIEVKRMTYVGVDMWCEDIAINILAGTDHLSRGHEVSVFVNDVANGSKILLLIRSEHL
jgi:hypothetical protein